jgi:hypothetical protein
MWWQNLKMKLMLASAVLTVIFVLFCIFCFQGGKNCTKKSD